jgi:hypothetical protein
MMAWKVKVYLSKDKEDWLYLVDEKTLEPKKVKVYLSKDKEDWLYLVDEKTLEPKVFDDWTDAQVEAHVWSYSDIEEVRRG